MNRSFAQIVNNAPVFRPLTINGKIVPNPTTAQYIAAKYKLVIDNNPGADHVFDHWQINDWSCIAVYREVEPEDTDREVSKFYLRVALTKLGKYDLFLELLSNMTVVIDGAELNGRDAYAECVALKESMISPYYDAIAAGLGIDTDTVKLIVSNCIVQ